jgi:hypothetical protein
VLFCWIVVCRLRHRTAPTTASCYASPSVPIPPSPSSFHSYSHVSCPLPPLRSSSGLPYRHAGTFRNIISTLPRPVGKQDNTPHYQTCVSVSVQTVCVMGQATGGTNQRSPAKPSGTVRAFVHFQIETEVRSHFHPIKRDGCTATTAAVISRKSGIAIPNVDLFFLHGTTANCSQISVATYSHPCLICSGSQRMW